MKKTCTRCGEEKPATIEYFHQYTNPKGEKRLRACCRPCFIARVKVYAPRQLAKLRAATAARKAEKARIAELAGPVPNDHFRCSTCSTVLPEWYRAEAGRGYCRGCSHFRKMRRLGRVAENQRRAEVERLFARAAELRRKRVDGVITCRVCAGEFPVALAWRNKANGSIESLCVSCKRLDGRMRRQIQKAEQLLDPSKTVRRAIRRGINAPSFSALVGYSIAELRVHLERQFVDGMNWDAFDRGEIHIDHIVPQRDFDLRDPAEFRSCWSLGNLRPLWAGDNLSKLGKRIYLL